MNTPSASPVPLDGYLASCTPVERELGRLFFRDERLTILDIGACEGEETIRYSRRFPRSRIFSFEPLPANQAIATFNLRRYAATNAELIPLALSNREGMTTFHVSSGRPPHAADSSDWNHGNKSSSLLPPRESTPMFGWLRFDTTIQVPARTLDSFAAERRLNHIDFIHMDVQGAEHLVLAGATRMLPSTTAVWLEVSNKELYAGQKLRIDMERMMQAAGFIKTLELRRDIEGDQLYLNMRRARTWPCMCARKIIDFLRTRRTRK